MGIPDMSKERARDLKRRMVELANRNDEAMDGTTGPVKALIAGADIVWAVWRDADEEDGVSMMLIKGHDALRRCVADGAPIAAGVTAIKCVDVRHATALARTFGEPDRRH